MTDSDSTNLSKRLRFRSHYRGTKEADKVLGTFAEQHLASFNAKQLEYFEEILNYPDSQLLQWILGHKPIPVHLDNEVMKKLCDKSWRTREDSNL